MVALDDSTHASIRVEDLLAFLDGEADARISEHIAGCARCQSDLAPYRALDARLRIGLFRSDCPSTLELGELALQLADPLPATRLRAHLAECPHCGAEYRELAAVAAGDPLAELRPAAGALRRLVARLITPPALGAAVAVRGSSAPAESSFQAEDVTISLAVVPGERRSRGAMIVGLVTSDLDEVVAPGTLVRAFAADATAHESETDDLGNFTLVDLADGVYSIELQQRDRIIVVESVQVGP